MFCASKSSIKVADSTSVKEQIKCGICASTKTILTLACKHALCVKCYNNYRYCVMCEKANARAKSWCC